MSYIDTKITGFICKFYPGTHDQCLAELPMTRIKFGISMLLILLGFLIIANKSKFIQKIIAFIFRHFSNAIGGVMVVIGGILLNITIMEMIYQ
jgi:hypothetical protein